MSQLRVVKTSGGGSSRSSKEERRKRETKRLNVNLPIEIFDELKGLADSSGRSLTELVRLALGLASVAITEQRRGNTVAVLAPGGEPIKELVLPS